MKELLDEDKILITNYPARAEEGGGPNYAHAVVIVGYMESIRGILYTCLDPATGTYWYRYEYELDWPNNTNKFIVAINK